MTIRFRCPNPACKKVLGVPDHLAGKKANCPACKKSFRIPGRKGVSTPTAAPANVEDLAAAAFADEPALSAAAASEKPRTISLECPYCAEQVEFPLEMGGKQAQCPNPECRRIVKVPMPAEEKKADWRSAGRDGLMGTKESVQRVLEAQEAANIKHGVVSGEALREAGAVPSREAPLTTGQRIGLWVRRGLVAAVVLGVGVGIWFWWSNYQNNEERAGLLDKVEPWLDAKKRKELPAEALKKLTPPMAADLARGLGEFYVRDREDPKQSIEKARRYFQGAAPPPNRVPTLEWEIRLTDTALSQIQLAGTDEQVQDKERLSWPDTQKEIARTLNRIVSLDGKLLALREVGGELLKRNKGEVAVALATEAAGGGKGAGPLVGAQVALLLALTRTDQAAKLLPPPKAGVSPDLATRLGYAEGWARTGDFTKARQLAGEKGPANDRAHAFLAVATAALQADKMDELDASLKKARDALTEERKGAQKHPLLLWQAARLAAWSSDPEQAKQLSALIADADLRARAELELLHRHLKDNRPADPKALNKKTPTYSQALEDVARSRTTQGQRAQVEQQAEQMEERQFRPFLFLGIALGEQDKHR
jgi:hypothetical protein